MATWTLSQAELPQVLAYVSATTPQLSWPLTSSRGGPEYLLFGTNALRATTDGLNWTDREVPFTPLSGAPVWWTGSQYCAAAPTAVYTSSDGVTWTQRTLPAAVSGSIQTFVWSGSLLALHTSGGQFFISSDGGSTWTTGTLPSASPVWLSAANGRLFFHRTDGGQYVYYISTDGHDWVTKTNSPYAGVSRPTIVGNGSVLLLYNASSSYIWAHYWSADNGDTWTMVSIDPDSYLRYYIVTVGSTFAVLGDRWTGTEYDNRHYYTSTDGVTWVRRTATLSGRYFAVGYSDTMVFALAGISFFEVLRGDLAMTSMQALLTATTPRLGAVLRRDDGTLWSLARVASRRGSLLRSADGGRTWTASAMPSLDSTSREVGGWHLLVAGPGGHVLAFDYYSHVARFDGAAWSAAVVLPSLSGNDWALLHTAVWTGSLYVLVAQSENRVARSTDGITWTLHTPTGLPAHNRIFAGAVGGAVVIYTAGPSSWVSSDGGLSWSATSPDFSAPPVVTPVGMLAVSTWAGLYLSADGIGWEQQRPDFSWPVSTNALFPYGASCDPKTGRVVYAFEWHSSSDSAIGVIMSRGADYTERWIVVETDAPSQPAEPVYAAPVADEDAIVLLDDGRLLEIKPTASSTWIEAVMPTGVYWNSIAYDGDRFVAVGDGVGGSVSAVSFDGENWGSALFSVTGNDGYCLALLHTGTRFVAMHYDGVVAVSLDGETWAEVATLSGSVWQTLLQFGGALYALRAYKYWGTQAPSRLAKSLDGGLTWSTPVPIMASLNGAPPVEVKARDIAVHNGALVAVIMEAGDVVSVVSHDGGVTWSGVDSAQTLGGTPARAVSNGRVIFASSWPPGYTARSLDGRQWERYESEPWGGVFAVAANDTLLAANYYGGNAVWLSFDDGATWQRDELPTGGLYMENAIAIGSFVFFIGDEGGAYKIGERPGFWTGFVNCEEVAE